MKKFKFFTILAVVCVTVSAVVGGTLAYFTDDKAMTSVFTSGNVYIELSEAAVKDDGRGNLVQDTEQNRIIGGSLAEGTTHNYGTLFPGQTIYKDPTIKNTGDYSAWIAAKLIVTDGSGDICQILGDPDEADSGIDIRALLGGGVIESSATVQSWNGLEEVRVGNDGSYAIVQKANRAEGRYEFYIFMLNKIEKGGSVTLFDKMTIDPDWTNAEMQNFVDFRITVQAFGVQTLGFENCFTAMTTAFGSHFGGLVPATTNPESSVTPNA